MRLFHTLVLTAALSLPATLGHALETQGHPILSDGTHAQSLQRQQGVHEINACGQTFFVGTEEGLTNYKRMKPQLDKGGYIYYHTTDPSKRYSVCGWGRYDHLNGELF